MSIKQDIVVVNEFTTPQPGGKGSRGGTPGDYVTRYMAREGATETLAPIQRLRTDDFVLRYMARSSAVERLDISAEQAKSDMRKAQGLGGVAFGYGSVSLSDEQLRAASADIQRLFERGHTVMKTVISFSDEYLVKHALVSPDFSLRERGDYRGHLDQMKLRMAVMHGLDKMAAGTGGFDDLRAISVIQTDTEHPHVHIAMVDAGRGSLTQDGTQRGKLLDRHTSRLRRGIDAFLDEKQAVAHLASAVGYERRNVMTFIKRWAHEKVRNESLPQFLLACLPQDRQLWRAGSHHPSMRKPNQIMRELITDQLERPDSPMPQAMAKVTQYANTRLEAEGLSVDQWRSLIDEGREQIFQRATNGVYQMLRALPEEELTVRTPMLSVMSMDYDQMAATCADSGKDDEGDLITFGFRLRSYASRLEYHRNKTMAFRDLSRQWEQARVSTVVAQDSRPLYDFYQHEAHYHHQLVAKYQHFLPFMGDASVHHDDLRELENYGQRLLALKAMRGDASLQRMKDSEAAERIGMAIYQQHGGSYLTQGRSGRSVLDQRLAKMETRYQEQLEDLRARLSINGLQLHLAAAPDAGLSQDVVGQDGRGDGQVGADDDGDLADVGAAAGGPGSRGRRSHPWVQQTSGLVVPAQQLLVVPGASFAFNDVKALDLHHLGYDFAADVPLSKGSVSSFTSAARTRRSYLLEAMDYLDASGQSQAIDDLPTRDVGSMLKLVADLQDQRAAGHGDSQLVLPSKIAQVRRTERVRRSATVSLDAQLSTRVQRQVDQVVATLEPGVTATEIELDAPQPADRGAGHEEFGV